MRQGGVPPTGKWVGTPQGGVKTPDPLVLPNSAIRFAASAARLEALAEGHPMAAWLRFMAALARAQHDAAAALDPYCTPGAGGD